MEVLTKSSKETRRLGEKISNSLKVKGERSKVKGAIILALTGELGNGKTTFVQGLSEGLGIKQRIISPTFIIMRKYRIKLITKNSKLKTKTQNLELENFYHIDLYRIEENIESEVSNLGIKDIWNNPENVVAIEWAEKIKKLLPKNTIWIKFENLGGERRKVTVS